MAQASCRPQRSSVRWRFSRHCRRHRRCGPRGRGAPRRPTVKRIASMPRTPVSKPTASSRPERWPGGRSIWLGSPVTTIFEPSPMRVRNIFICMLVVFCASSRMTKAVRQRAPAHEGQRRDLDDAGLEVALHLGSAAARRRARRRAGADRDRPSRACRRAGSRGARPPPRPDATARCGRPARARGTGAA